MVPAARRASGGEGGPHPEAGCNALRYRPDGPNRFTGINHATIRCDIFFNLKRVLIKES